eukprot:GILJ01001175.1.p1 GENE.GILJ01001175.1~~GILJ01001175.1.p1  ORF type:complete len:227 (+),score=20.82 GILJ01001175.1:47-727(+)
MAASLARGFASNAASSIGSSLGSMVKGSGGGSGGSNEPQIDWENFNYPPKLRIIHYDPKELQQPVKGIVLKMNWCFKIFVFTLAWNILACIILGAGGYQAISIFYAILDFVIGSCFGLYTFYTGYKGIATRPISPSMLRKYTILQSILVVVMFIFSIVGDGPLHGWTLINKDVSGFASATAVMESIALTIAYLLGIYCVVKVNTFDGRSSPPMTMSSAGPAGARRV